MVEIECMGCKEIYLFTSTQIHLFFLLLYPNSSTTIGYKHKPYNKKQLYS